MDANALRDLWLMFEREHGCSIDKMLCDPTLRQEFVAAAASATGCPDEQQLLWGLVSLRKRKALTRKSA